MRKLDGIRKVINQNQVHYFLHETAFRKYDLCVFDLVSHAVIKVGEHELLARYRLIDNARYVFSHNNADYSEACDHRAHNKILAMWDEYFGTPIKEEIEWERAEPEPDGAA